MHGRIKNRALSTCGPSGGKEIMLELIVMNKGILTSIYIFIDLLYTLGIINFLIYNPGLTQAIVLFTQLKISSPGSRVFMAQAGSG